MNKPLSKGQKLLPGIFGGVGPAASIDFERHIIEESNKRGARSDQDHPTWIHINAASTPDRTKNLIYGEETPVPHMQTWMQALENAGADFLFTVCNTGHAFHKDVQPQLNIPWIHLMDVTAAHIREYFPGIKNVGILATDGTLFSKLYHDALQQVGLNPISPEVGSDIQKGIMSAIYDPGYGIKSSGVEVTEQAVDNLHKGANWCVEKGADAIILACTEIPLAIHEHSFKKAELFNPMAIAANLLLDLSSGKTDLEKYRVKY